MHLIPVVISLENAMPTNVCFFLFEGLPLIYANDGSWPLCIEANYV
ncbi:hypothetical protein MCAMS1_00663 [biofilm metagenome]